MVVDEQKSLDRRVELTHVGEEDEFKELKVGAMQHLQ